MLNHTCIFVNNYDETCKFYDQILDVLGWEILLRREDTNITIYGANWQSSFLVVEKATEVKPIDDNKSFAIRFGLNSHEDLQKVYQKFLELGAKDIGDGIKVRDKFSASYYSALLVDPNGFTIEPSFHDCQASFCSA